MVQISKRKIDKYVLNKLLDLLFEIFVISRNQAEFNIFFISLFSPAERTMIVKRLGLIYLLLKGVNNYNICKLLKISSATLDKYRLILDKNIEIYEYFKNIIQKEKIKNIFEDVFNSLYGPGTPGVDWSEAWKTKRRIIRRKKFGI